jgi:hypothetical protein
MDSTDPFFLKGGLDLDTSHIHVKDIGIDSSLDNSGWQVDPFGGQSLDQGFRDNTPAHVAAGRAWDRKIPGLKNIQLHFQSYPFRHGKKKVAEKGASRTRTDHGNTRIIIEMKHYPQLFS